jgi:hypothetical protein
MGHCIVKVFSLCRVANVFETAFTQIRVEVSIIHTESFIYTRNNNLVQGQPRIFRPKHTPANFGDTSTFSVKFVVKLSN